MATAPKLTFTTIDEYFALEERFPDVRHEYIDGQVHAMAGGTPAHAALCAVLLRLLGNQLRGSGCTVYTSDARVQLSVSRYVYPDLTISCHQADRTNSTAIRTPRVVVEVLSPSTERRDRTSKVRMYLACASIEEYLLVDSQRQWVDLLRRNGNTWTLLSFTPEETITLESVHCSIPFADIYEDSDLPPLIVENIPDEEPEAAAETEAQ